MPPEIIGELLAYQARVRAQLVCRKADRSRRPDRRALVGKQGNPNPLATFSNAGTQCVELRLQSNCALVGDEELVAAGEQGLAQRSELGADGLYIPLHFRQRLAIESVEIGNQLLR